MAASNKQICKAADTLDQANTRLQALKDRKQELQDELALVTTQITDAQTATTNALAALKTLVNEP